VPNVVPFTAMLLMEPLAAVASTPKAFSPALVKIFTPVLVELPVVSIFAPNVSDPLAA
jgi:hypothetical protein